MDDALDRLLHRLADGQLHNGQALADELAVSRTAVWKRIEALRALGLDIRARPGGGYQLDHPLQRLNLERIRGALGRADIALDLRFLVDSSNACLARELDKHPPPRALIVEAQDQGRGRRGRPWLSPPGAGLYLSLAWRFESGLGGLASLSLVVGVAAAEVLQDLGLAGLGLKWPNDLMVAQRKLGGCLIELSGAADGPCDAIIGLGINLDLPADSVIDQAWTDLKREGIEPDRDHLAAAILRTLIEAFERLDRTGVETFLERWRKYDSLKGRPLRIQRGARPDLVGEGAGIDDQGRLRVRTEHGLEAIVGGEVHVRTC
jgi:BirA family biotin operon repressor/biotin-[acetyl-CoA-carboxylase] ligase